MARWNTSPVCAGTNKSLIKLLDAAHFQSLKAWLLLQSTQRPQITDRGEVSCRLKTPANLSLNDALF